jgi:erythromycin esterase
MSSDAAEQVLQSAKIVVQCVEGKMAGKTSRYESMASNVEWIIHHFGKDTKIVLWAHNAHVSKYVNQSSQPMGSYLDKAYSKDMIVFGFGFNGGKYTAFGKKGLGSYATSLPQPGSLEWILNQTNKDQLIFDLRKVKGSPLFPILAEEIEFRSIGAMAMDEAFSKTKILDEYDAVIYFNKTSPTACFGITNKLK